MSIGELSLPIRVYWDLPESITDAVDPVNVCEELIECGILSLDLRETSASIKLHTLDIVDRFTYAERSVSLTILPSALDDLSPSDLAPLSLTTLLVHADDAEGIHSILHKISALPKAMKNLGISLQVTPENILALPQVLKLLDGRISKLVMPITREDERDSGRLLPSDEWEPLAQRLEQIDYSLVSIDVHDPFLWEALYKGEGFHESACQAGNSLIHITPQYDVYPCPILPISLGNLATASFRETILCEKKKSLRAELSSAPDECRECSMVKRCQGGCRGRAYVAYESFTRCDPACTF
ncbi:MAG: SPASM domain-containing protein [Deltaproteobacteria bacterium]|nr:SPASM domain-containing protein [Deltaproteobacteria bacterium]